MQQQKPATTLRTTTGARRLPSKKPDINLYIKKTRHNLIHPDGEPNRISNTGINRPIDQSRLRAEIHRGERVKDSQRCAAKSTQRPHIIFPCHSPRVSEQWLSNVCCFSRIGARARLFRVTPDHQRTKLLP